MTDVTKAEVHILNNEEESKAYIVQAWAEAMVIYQQGNIYLSFTRKRKTLQKNVQRKRKWN